MTPFSQHHMPDLIRLRDKSVACDDEVIPHRRNPDLMLVTAQSFSSEQARAYYRVNVRHGTCTCKSFAIHANCRHLARVSWELHKAKSMPANVVPFRAVA